MGSAGGAEGAGMRANGAEPVYLGAWLVRGRDGAGLARCCQGNGTISVADWRWGWVLLLTPALWGCEKRRRFLHRYLCT